ncbi:APC family permease [Seonamhaeicola marinus]|uniref:Amino acid permease n=1 Tax=Seonamhaeicola marinus TaxID=1912246 RepID=A0A5D0H3Y3_9FLAO|nr:APC family permease [Seonamhaeicola marinus]TYA65986.1 amino acid permease [Seonamhaeicola marinus]
MKKDKGLKRSIGTIGLSANIINVIIGAGIFALPAVIASKMGASSIVAFLFCGVLIALIMLCFAEVGSKVTVTGGPYTYIETAFGKYAGFLGGIFIIGGTLFADAAVSNALVSMLVSSYPIFAEEWVRLLTLFLLFFGLGSVNVLGLKQGIGLVKFNTLAKLIPLLVLVTLGWKGVSSANLVIEAMPDFKTIGETSLILFFAFQGAETGLVVGGEVKQPGKTIPKGILISILFVVLIYILIQSVCQGILGDSLPKFEAAPLAEAAKEALGPIGFTLLFVGAMVSMFGYMSGAILNNPRILYALSRDRVLPIPFLSKIHRSFATPANAIIIYAIIAFTIAASGNFKKLAVIASSAMLLAYLGVALAVIKLRLSKSFDSSGFKIPGGFTIPILSVGLIVYFLTNIPSNDLVITLIVIGILSLIHLIIKVLSKRKTLE